MSKVYNVAVVGATGAVGEAMLAILEERNFPVGEVYALASSNSVGKRIPFKNGSLRVEDLATFDFSKAQIGLFSPGASISEKCRVASLSGQKFLMGHQSALIILIRGARL